MDVIEPPPNFFHVGQLPAGLMRSDPRNSPFKEFAIDLRRCEFLRPPTALWCVVYCLLAAKQGTTCQIVVPESIGVARYLKAMGMFDLLKEGGVEVDDRDIAPAAQRQMAMPIQRFDSMNDVDRIANEAIESLSEHDLGAANLRPVVVEAFAELAGNAVEHAESSVGSYGMIQYYDWQQAPRFICVVADGGIGIRESLMRNPALQSRVFYDWTAIELALKERTSGTGLPTRGIGPFAVADDMRSPGRELLIHSGLGIVGQSEELETDAHRGSLFPGTLAYASVGM